MRAVFFFFAIFLLSCKSFAQFSAISLKEADIKTLGEISKNATLVLAINNEKDPSDAALINAVKMHWKAGKYKLISRAEFFTQQKKKELSKSDLYLYEGSVSSAHDVENPALLANVKSGVFYLSVGEQKPEIIKTSGFKIETTSAVKLKFDLSSTMSNSKDKIYDGYFNLMVKYFNHEIEFCRKFTSLKDISKEEKEGVVYFNDGQEQVKAKDILLIKEQVNRNKITEKNKTSSPADIVAQFNPTPKNVYTVFPEDIKMALVKGDSKVALYTNDMLINASDGSVIAAYSTEPDGPAKGDPKFWAAALGIFATALIIALIL